jgi:hypothetical protein
MKLFLCLNTTPGRCGGVKVKFHTSLTPALDGSEWSASCSGCFATLCLGLELHYLLETGCAPEPVLTWWQREKFLPLPLPGIECVIQPITSHITGQAVLFSSLTALSIDLKTFEGKFVLVFPEFLVLCLKGVFIIEFELCKRCDYRVKWIPE